MSADVWVDRSADGAATWVKSDVCLTHGLYSSTYSTAGVPRRPRLRPSDLYCTWWVTL